LLPIVTGTNVQNDSSQAESPARFVIKRYGTPDVCDPNAGMVNHPKLHGTHLVAT